LIRRIAKGALALALIGAAVVEMIAPLPAASADDVWLRSYRDVASRVPVGVLGVVGQPGLDVPLGETREVLMADLRRSGVFTARDLELHMAAPPDETLGPVRIRDMGLSEAVDVMVWASLSRDELGRFTLHSQVFDAARGKMIIEKRQRAPESQLRELTHRLVGEIIHHYTGEYGITRSRIAFVSDLTGTKEVFVMDHDGYAPKRVTADRNIGLTPALAQGAKTVLYASQKSGNWRIYKLDLDSGVRSVAFSSQGLSMTPVWHPEGNGFAVTGSEQGSREIYHVTGDGRVIQLTNHRADDLSPTWSADGRLIAFTSNRGGNPQIYVMNAGGGRAKRITFGGDYNSEPDWSPTGELIAYTCRSGQWFKICVTTPDGRNNRQISPDGDWDDESPSFSPDGRHIAFASTRGGRQDIYLMSPDGGDVERVTYNGANNTSPDWASEVDR